MTFSAIQRYLLLPAAYLILSIFLTVSILPAPAFATDIQAQLDSHDGTSGFTIEGSTGVGVDRFDSNGNLGLGTTTAQSLLYVSPQGMTPLYAGPQDAYIQNNLEVDGTTYMNDVVINGLEVNGLTFTGQPSLNTLGVTGNAYLGTSGTGKVGIGTVSPGSKLTVNGGGGCWYEFNLS